MRRFTIFTVLLSIWGICMMAETASPVRVLRRAVDGVYHTCDMNHKVMRSGVSENTVARQGIVSRGGSSSDDGGGSSGGGSSSWDDDYYMVKCSYEWNPEKWMLQYMTAVNETGVYDGEYQPYDYSQGPTPVPVNYAEVELPEGVYDFIGQFVHINSAYRYGYDYEAFIIKEGVEVYGDTELTFDPDEATVEIKVVTYNPDGSVSAMSKGTLVSEDDYQVTEEGNITMALLQSQVHHETYGQVLGRIYEVSGQVTAGDFGLYDGFAQADFHINQVSDKYSFRQLRLMPSAKEGEGTLIAVAWQRGAAPGTISNDPASYVDCSQKFVTSPVGTANPAGASSIEYGLYTPAIFNGGQSAMTIGLAGRTEKSLKAMCSDAANPDKPVGGLYSLQARFTDAAIESETGSSSSGGMQIYTNIGGTLNPFGGEEPEYLMFPAGDFRYWPGGYLFPVNPYPGNSAMSVPYKTTSLCNGSSAPLLTSYISETYNPYAGYAIPYFKYSYRGSLGEERYSDSATLAVKMYSGGELTGEGEDALFEWSFFYDPKNNAPMKIELVDDNYDMNGHKGGNSAEISFDLTKEDHYPPTLTMLQFRDAVGRVVQEVDNPEGLALVLTATDYENMFGEPNSWGSRPNWLQCSAPASVKAEISPYGENRFTEIALTADADKFYGHGFGAWYSGSLSGLDTRSDDGIFDLRVSVSDEAGNSQIQTISGALKVKSLAGTESVESARGLSAAFEGNILRITSESPVEVEVYDTVGVMITRSHSTAVSFDSYLSGTYVIRIKNGSETVILKYMNR